MSVFTDYDFVCKDCQRPSHLITGTLVPLRIALTVAGNLSLRRVRRPGGFYLRRKFSSMSIGPVGLMTRRSMTEEVWFRMQSLKELERFVGFSMSTPLSCVEFRGESNGRVFDLLVPAVSKLLLRRSGFMLEDWNDRCAVRKTFDGGEKWLGGLVLTSQT